MPSTGHGDQLGGGSKLEVEYEEGEGQCKLMHKELRVQLGPY